VLLHPHSLGTGGSASLPLLSEGVHAHREDPSDDGLIRATHRVSRSEVRLELDMEGKGLDFAAYFHLATLPEWRHQYLDLRRLSHLVDTLWATHRDGAGVASLFVRALQQDMAKVSAFYRTLEQSFVAHHVRLVAQISRCAELTHPHTVAPRDPAVTSVAKLKQHAAELAEARKMHLARDAIRKAIGEHNEGLAKVEKFCALNEAAVRSLGAQFDRLARVHREAPIADRVEELLDAEPFVKTAIGQQRAELERLFVETFYPNQSSTVVKWNHKKRLHRTATFFIGLCIGLLIANVVLIVYLLAITPDNLSLPYWSSQYLIFRGSFLILLMFWYQSVNMFVWSRKRVNFRYILEIGHPHKSVRECLLRFFCANSFFVQHFDVFLLLAPLTAVSALLFSLYLFAARGNISTISPRWIGFIQFVLLLVVLCFPFNLLLRSSRGWVLGKMLRVACAPFLQVHFADFYVGDQLCSCLVALYDVEFSFCFIFYDVWTGGSVCLATAPTARLCLAGIPSLFRFLQCLRRWRDSKFRDPIQAANAGKYASVFAVVIVNGIGKGTGSATAANGIVPPMSIAFIAVSAVSYIYNCFWDVYMDWGLFRRHQTHRFLRHELLYRYAIIYYICVPLDWILRLAWIITVSPGVFGISLNNDLLQFFLAIAEQTRRFMWSFFRMENEASNNVGKYRAVLEVPLPYDEELLDDPVVQYDPVSTVEQSKNVPLVK
jgi:hypothetical protein